jgi:hypothetical protein
MKTFVKVMLAYFAALVLASLSVLADDAPIVVTHSDLAQGLVIRIVFMVAAVFVLAREPRK